MVSLVAMDSRNWRSALEVRVQPERLHWVSSREPVALMLLAKSYVRPDGQEWFPLIIEDESRVVGVVGIGLDVATDAPSIPQTAWVHHFLIDEREQGRGYGRAAVRELARWARVRHPSISLIGLNVLADNHVAFRLYRSLGFEPIALTRDDQSILVASLSEVAADALG